MCLGAFGNVTIAQSHLWDRIINHSIKIPPQTRNRRGNKLAVALN